MEDYKHLADFGITAETATVQDPMELAVVFRKEGGAGWEEIEKTPFTTPPALPDAMKPD